MYFPAEHLLDKLEISSSQLEDFEGKGIVHGIAKAGAFFTYPGICTGSRGYCCSLLVV